MNNCTMKSKTNKKPVAVVITDTHMHDKNIDLVRNIFKQTFEFCKANNISLIFHGGDWFTSRVGQSIACLTATKEILHEMHRKYGLEMWAVAGNHDKADQSVPESFLSVFEGLSGFNLVAEIDGVFLYEEKLSISMMPFYSKEVYEKKLSEFSIPIPGDRNRTILITHVAANGARNNDGSEVTTGHPTNLFSKFDKVLVGHYHNKSKVGKNIHYIGSAYQDNFGEDADKGITVIYSDGDIEQVKLDFPKFIKYEINAKDLSAKEIKSLQKERQESGNNIRIILKGSEEEVNSVNKNLLLDAGISVDKKIDDIVVAQEEDSLEAVTYNKENLIVAFKEFSKERNLKDNKYGLEKLKEL